MNQSPYRHLLIMTALSFVSMYVLMYAMVNSLENVYSSINQVYMAGLMTVPMVVIELIVMRAMHDDTRRNALILAASFIAGLACFAFIRQQAAVSDRLQSAVRDRSDDCETARADEVAVDLT